MLHFMLILALLTVLALGWFAGNIFVCVFLTLPIVGLMLLFATGGGPAVGTWELGFGAVLVAIWLPRYIRLGMR